VRDNQGRGKAAHPRGLPPTRYAEHLVSSAKVLVVFTERVASGIVRIISARRATKRERRAYAEGD